MVTPRDTAVRSGSADEALQRACSECRTLFEPDWQVCAHCSTRLATHCPRCSVPLPPAGSLRCGHCGLLLITTSSEVEHRTPEGQGIVWRRAVALVSERARAEIEKLMPLPGIDLDFVDRIDQLSNRIESACPAIVIIDTELLSMPGEHCAIARSLRPDVLTVALVNHWSEREERLHGAVDAVLHKPPRIEEWQRLLA